MPQQAGAEPGTERSVVARGARERDPARDSPQWMVAFSMCAVWMRGSSSSAAAGSRLLRRKTRTDQCRRGGL